MELTFVTGFLIFCSVLVEGDNQNNKNDKVKLNPKMVVNDTDPTRYQSSENAEICLRKLVGEVYNPSKEWYDDKCHQYRCERVDGRFVVVVLGCLPPAVPPDATLCYKFVVDTKNVMFPECCTRLRCIMKKNNEKYIQVIGQPEENFPMERLHRISKYWRLIADMVDGTNKAPDIYHSIHPNNDHENNIKAEPGNSRVKKEYTDFFEDEEDYLDHGDRDYKQKNYEQKDYEQKELTPKKYTMPSVIRKFAKEVTILYHKTSTTKKQHADSLLDQKVYVQDQKRDQQKNVTENKMYTKPIVIKKRATYHEYEIQTSPIPHYKLREATDPIPQYEVRKLDNPYQQISRRIEENERYEDEQEEGKKHYYVKEGEYVVLHTTPMSKEYRRESEESNDEYRMGERDRKSVIRSTVVYDKDAEYPLKRTTRNYDNNDNDLEESKKSAHTKTFESDSAENEEVNEKGIFYESPRQVLPPPKVKDVEKDKERKQERKETIYDDPGFVKDPRSLFKLIARASAKTRGFKGTHVDSEEDTARYDVEEKSSKMKTNDDDEERRPESKDTKTYREKMEENEVERDARKFRRAHKLVKTRGKYKFYEDEEDDDEKEERKHKRMKKKCHHEENGCHEHHEEKGAKEQDDDDLENDEDAFLSALEETHYRHHKKSRSGHFRDDETPPRPGPSGKPLTRKSALDWILWPFQAIFMYNFKIMSCLIPFI